MQHLCGLVIMNACMYIHANEYTCMHAHTCIIFVDLCLWMHAYACTRKRVCMHACTHTQRSIHSCMYIHAKKYTCLVHSHTTTRTQAYMHTCIIFFDSFLDSVIAVPWRGVCVCMYVCMYVCKYVNVDAHVYVFVFELVCMCVCVFVRTYVYIHICM